MSAKRTLGAASRSSPSLRWNSSRYSSGTRPTSRNESTWPSFIAAPFIVPSAVTICSAASRWRRSSASRLPCSPRVRFAACVPSWRAPWPAASPAMRAVRATRDVGMRSFGIAGMVSGRGRRARRGRRGLRRDVRRGRRRRGRGGRRASRSASGSASACASRRPPASSSASASASRRVAVAPRAAVEERGRVAVVAADALAGEQLRAGDEDRRRRRRRGRRCRARAATAAT